MILKQIYPLNRRSFQAAFFFAVLFATNVQSQESAPQHRLSASCCSDAGLLICSTCREAAGLAPVLTPGNTEGRIQSEPRKPTKLTSFTTASPKTDVRDENERKQDRKKSTGKKRITGAQTRTITITKSPHHPFILRF